MKNIILCSDGTGNSGGKTRGTNVWRIFNAVDRYNAKKKQITFYDDGVGTDDWKPLKILGGAFGWGLSRNIRQLDSFLVQNYEENDKIFLFGFSRGAFTVRALAGMVCKCGLLDKKQYLTSKDRDDKIKKILQAYRQAGKKKLEKNKSDGFELKEIKIDFIGVWDTVDAVGIPSDYVRKWADGGYKFLTGRRLYGFHDQELNKNVLNGYQALAIDDARKTFHPNIWEERDNVEQVWFAGAHSNVGGGYPKDGMSLVTLDWMMEKAKKHGVEFIKDDQEDFRRDADVHAKLYNPRSGFKIYYSYALRDMGKTPRIHTSVYKRIACKTGQYAPGIIPHDAEIAYSDKGPFSKDTLSDPPKLDAAIIGKVKKLGSFRKGLYIVFVIFNFIVAGLLVYIMLNPPAHGGMTLPWPWAQEFVKLLVPGFLERIVEVVWEHPVWSGFFIVIFGILKRISTITKRKMNENAFQGWQMAFKS